MERRDFNQNSNGYNAQGAYQNGVPSQSNYAQSSSVPPQQYQAGAQPGIYNATQQYQPSAQPTQQYQVGAQQSQQYQQSAQSAQPYQQPLNSAVPTYAGVAPVTQESAASHADKKYSKGARRGGVWRFLFIVALAILLFSLGAIGYVLFTYWDGQREYDELTEYMTVTDPSEYKTLASFEIDWDALSQINPDVVGWVYIPDTIVNYPIVWKENDDKYYLNRSFGDNTNGDFGAEYGCIMLSGVDSPEWNDQVEVLFGHHLNNGAMFATLAGFIEDDEFNAHRTIYVLTPKGNFRLNSFAVNKVPGTSTDIVIPNFPTEEQFQEYIQKRLAANLVTPVPPAVAPSEMKQIFAFSTCSKPDNNNRIITFCTVEEFLPAGSDVSKGNAIENENDINAVVDMSNARLQ